jgi:hypothetical protein
MNPKNFPTDHTQTKLSDDLYAVLDATVACICALACFPYSSYKLIHNWGDKANVLVRGAAVIISPLVGALSLCAYAAVIFPNAPFVMVLPFISLLIDWLNCASAYGNTGISRSMWMLRCGLVLISVVIAGYASLLSEQSNLMKELNNQERILAIQNSNDIQALNTKIDQYRKAIAENESRIQSKTALVLKMREKTRLADKECNGAAGVDEATGIKIFGGKCKGRAFNHRADADAAQAQINEIETLPGKSFLLEQKIIDAEKQVEGLIAPHLSDPNSTGSLIKSVQYADFGVLLQIAFRLAILMFMELLALILAHIPVSKNLHDAVEFVVLEDARRIANAHQVAHAEIHGQHIQNRNRLGANHLPVIVQVPAANSSRSPLHAVR